jgi:hypothetical protein
MVSGYIAGRQARAEFSYGVQEFATRLSDIANDVATGYYEKVSEFNCTAGPVGAPQINAGGSVAQGENTGCIFIGRVIQFDPDGIPDIPEDQGYTTFSVAGRRVVRTPSAATRESQNFNDSYTVPIYRADGTVSPTTSTIPNGIRVAWVRYATAENAAPTTTAGAVGFFTNFGFNTTLNQQSVRNVQVFPIPNSALDQTTDTAAGYITGVRAAYNAGTLPNPRGGAVVCLISPTGRLSAAITLSGNLRQQLSDIEIKSGATPCTD